MSIVGATQVWGDPYTELRRRREHAAAARLELAHELNHPERMLLALWAWRDRQAMFGQIQDPAAPHWRLRQP